MFISGAQVMADGLRRKILKVLNGFSPRRKELTVLIILQGKRKNHRKEGERVFKGEGVTIKDKTIPLEDAGIILNGLCDFVQGVYDLKMYHVKMQRQFLQEKGMTQEELKDIEANAPDQYAIIKAEAKAWLKGQAEFIPSLPRLEKITEKPAR